MNKLLPQKPSKSGEQASKLLSFHVGSHQRPYFIFALCLFLLFLSGIPALLLLELYKIAKIGLALDLGNITQHSLFVLFYCFTLGSCIPTTALLAAFSLLKRAPLKLELSEDGIRQVPSLFNVFFSNSFYTIAKYQPFIRTTLRQFIKVRNRELARDTRNLSLLGQMPKSIEPAVPAAQFTVPDNGSPGTKMPRQEFEQLTADLADRLPVTGVTPWADIESIESLGIYFAITWRYGENKEQRARCIFQSSEIDKIQRLQLVSAFRRYKEGADGSLLDLSTAIEQAPKNKTYTDIWFDGFKKEERKDKSDLLPAESPLRNGAYQIIQSLNGGGLSNVYLAASLLEQNERVILKEFILSSSGKGASIESSARFNSELAILQMIDHPGIVRLRDHFIEDYRAYLVLEYIPGKSLLNHVSGQGPFPEKELVPRALEMCKILKYLHGLTPPVVHRDFTPHNLLLADRLKLIDFNAALHYYRKPGERDEVVGKPAYVPPEQFRGRATAQSDIYAMGATLFFMLTGMEPEAISESHPREFAVVSPELDRIVAQSTNLSLSRRYKDSDELLADLLAIEQPG